MENKLSTYMIFRRLILEYYKNLKQYPKREFDNVKEYILGQDPQDYFNLIFLIATPFIILSAIFYPILGFLYVFNPFRYIKAKRLYNDLTDEKKKIVFDTFFSDALSQGEGK